MSTTPDSIDPVVGWRMWSLVPARGRGVESCAWVLGSPFKRTAWRPYAPVLATCRVCRDSPTKGCTCGVYAYLTSPFVEDAPLSLGARGPRSIALAAFLTPCVIGQVAGWGRVVHHTKGWRAAKVYPLSLALVCVGCLAAPGLFRRADFVCSSVEGPPWATCEAHLGAYPSGPRDDMRACDAAEAERALASRYGVHLAEIPGRQAGFRRFGETTR